MPKRYTGFRPNPEPETPMDDPDGPIDAPQPKKKKRKLIPGWLKWVGATAAGAVIGGIAMRKYDEYSGYRRNPEPLPEPNPAQGALPSPNMPMPYPMPVPMPMFPTAPPAISAPASGPPAAELSVGELRQLVKRKVAAQKARRSRAVEEEFWED
jgi:hypothetical protein